MRARPLGLRLVATIMADAQACWRQLHRPSTNVELHLRRRSGACVVFWVLVHVFARVGPSFAKAGLVHMILVACCEYVSVLEPSGVCDVVCRVPAREARERVPLVVGGGAVRDALELEPERVRCRWGPLA